jgi:hypothetical protein
LYAEIPNLATDAAQRVGTLLSDECDLALKRENHNSRRALLALVTFLLLICTWAFHTKLMTGSLAASANRSLEADLFHRKETSMRFNSQIGVAAGVAAMSIAANACAQTAVEWRVEDGGNGHWYAAGDSSTCASWTQARDAAVMLNGHLVTITTAAESAFVRSQFNGFCFIGLFQNRESLLYTEPAGGWEWVTNEPVVFTNWRTQPREDTEPNNSNGDEDYAHLNFDPEATWNDVTGSWCAGFPHTVRAIIEWSADCNNDGLVDYGQILAGDLSDANANNIPDCCEGSASCDPCPADIVHDGFVNAIDLAAVLNNWGSAGGKINADANDDGLVDAQDLAIVLSAWGACE